MAQYNCSSKQEIPGGTEKNVVEGYSRNGFRITFDGFPCPTQR
ncbi:hypothetical protein [Gardnerella vaginalis]